MAISWASNGKQKIFSISTQKTYNSDTNNNDTNTNTNTQCTYRKNSRENPRENPCLRATVKFGHASRKN